MAGHTLRRPIDGTGVTLETLAGEALAAREFAFAPHSGFKVGAAVLTRGGRVFRGCNVECAAYPLTNCAERVAIQKAVSEGERAILAVAVAGDASYLRQAETGAGGVEAGTGRGTPATGDRDPGAAGSNARTDLDRFVTPCGGCRQVIYEFGPDAPVLLVDLEGGRLLTSARELLPGGFRLEGSAG